MQVSPRSSESAPLRAEKFVRRQPLQQRIQSSLSRRRSGAIAMAGVALATLAQRRVMYDSVFFMGSEAVLCIGAILCATWFHRLRFRGEIGETERHTSQHSSDTKSRMLAERSSVATTVWLVIAFATPWVINAVAKRNGFGNGTEIVMLGSLGWMGLACAALATQSRTISLSVVCSGFVALFATLISDVASATWFAYAWVALCMWWLVGNHWESLESRAAERIDRSVGMRWVYIALGVVVFSGSVLSLGDRVPVWRKLQAELMPTSGGTKHKDSVARKGVGNGDALIAAKNHATSFGAVETDLFLDSEKPSLFDVFSDEFGEPKVKEKVERAQGLAPQDVQSEEAKYSEANRSSSESEFGIERKQAERKPPPEDLFSNALFFWQGAAHAHLAVERFHRFDGETWSGQLEVELGSPRSLEPDFIEIETQTWFFARGNKFASSLSPYRGAVNEAVKFTRYGSPVIPSRCGTKLWCIDKITLPEFFHYDGSDCLLMPGREHVPDYTVVRFVNGEIDLERMADLMQHCSPGKGHVRGAKHCQEDLAAMAHDYAGKALRGWTQVQAVISGLRNDFRHKADMEPTDERPALEQFLKDRAGPSYLFATAAAMMLEHLGYETRLVTGFYVSPEHYAAADNEYAVQPGDAHVWLEVNAGHGYWIPLEPTPGYRAPRYSASLWYILLQNRWKIAACLLSFSLAAMCLYLLRAWFFDWICWLCSPILVLIGDKQCVCWTAWVLDLRLSLLGRRRPRGEVLRRHLAKSLDLSEQFNHKVRTVLDASDSLLFGKQRELSAEQRSSIHEVWRELTVSRLRKLRIAANT